MSLILAAFLALGRSAWAQESGAAALAPGHLRAAAVPPEHVASLDGPRDVRVWWDEGLAGPVDVEIGVDGRFKRAAKDAAPGVTLRRVQAGAVVRLRGADGAVSEAAPVVFTLSPAGLARVGDTTRLSGAEVTTLASDETGAWVASWGGGLARVSHSDVTVWSWGRAEGLPSELVLSVAIDGDHLWIGTAAGLALADEGGVIRVWDAADGLGDPWVWAVAPDGAGGAWVGTDDGLARIDAAGGVTTLTDDAPVLSLAVTSDGRGYAGGMGLMRLPVGDVVPEMDGGLGVLDLDIGAEGLSLATETEGLLYLSQGLLTPIWRPSGGAVYSLARAGTTLFAAAGSAGLIAVDDVMGPKHAWGAAEGLPPGAVVSVALGPPGSLWVGTSSGLALFRVATQHAVVWPAPRLPAGRAALALLAGDDWVIVGGDQGLGAVGALPRGWDALLMVPGPVIALAQDGDWLYVVTEDGVWRAGGRAPPRRFDLPAEVNHAVFSAGSLWLGGPKGLYRLDLGQDRLVPGPAREPVRAMSADGLGVLWVALGERVIAVGGNGERFDLPGQHVAMDLLATNDRLYALHDGAVRAIHRGSGDVAATYRLDAPLVALGGSAERPLGITSAGAVVSLGEGSAPEALEPFCDAPTEVVVDAVGRTWSIGPMGACALGR